MAASSSSVQNELMAIGMDLGTTNSVVAGVKDGRVVVFPDDNGQVLLPSIVTFTVSPIPLVGQTAKDQMPRHASSSVFDFKRLIGRKFQEEGMQEFIMQSPYRIQKQENGDGVQIVVTHQGQTLTVEPEMVTSIVAKKLRSMARHALYLNLEDQHQLQATITVPARFNDSQRQATKDAGEMADLTVTRIINEPTAAAVALVYGLVASGKECPENILVFDLGGGTFDVSIVEVAIVESKYAMKVVVTGGDTKLGGSDISKAVMRHCLKEIDDQFHADVEVYSPSALAMLQQAVDRAKCALSTERSAIIELKERVDNIDVNYSMTLTRTALEGFAKATVDSCMKHVSESLIQANKSAIDIDEVVLVGGPTRMPMIRQMLTDMFGKPPNTSLNPDTAVAEGACIVANNGAVVLQDRLQLQDVLSHSLGIELKGGVMHKILDRFQKVPAEAEDRNIFVVKERFQNVVGECKVNVVIYEGEDPQANRNLHLGVLSLVFPNAATAINSKLIVKFSVNLSGILSVTVEDTSTGIHGKVDCTLNKGRLDQQAKASVRTQVHLLTEDQNAVDAMENQLATYMETILNREGLSDSKMDRLQRLFDETIADIEKARKGNTLTADSVKVAFMALQLRVNAFLDSKTETEEDDDVARERKKAKLT